MYQPRRAVLLTIWIASVAAHLNAANPVDYLVWGNDSAQLESELANANWSCARRWGRPRARSRNPWRAGLNHSCS